MDHLLSRETWKAIFQWRGPNPFASPPGRWKAARTKSDAVPLVEAAAPSPSAGLSRALGRSIFHGSTPPPSGRGASPSPFGDDAALRSEDRRFLAIRTLGQVCWVLHGPLREEGPARDPTTHVRFIRRPSGAGDGNGWRVSGILHTTVSRPGWPRGQPGRRTSKSKNPSRSKEIRYTAPGRPPRRETPRPEAGPKRGPPSSTPPSFPGGGAPIGVVKPVRARGGCLGVISDSSVEGRDRSGGAA